MKRLFWLAFGAAAGVLVARQIRQTAADLAPTNVLVKTLDAVRDLWEDVREVAAEREDELRQSFGLDDGDAPASGIAPDRRGI